MYTFRLNQHIEVSSDKQLLLDEICNAINTEISKHALGRIIQKVFPSISVKRTRCKDNWASKCITYSGIFWRQSSEQINFDNISEISRDFFILQRTEERITMAHILKSQINLNKIIVEVEFVKDFSWSVSICGKSGIKPSSFGLNDLFTLDKNNLLGILDSIRSLRLCQGILSKEQQKIIENESETEIIKEIFTISSAENSSKTVVRSVKCSRIMNFRSHASTDVCTSCKGLLKNIEREPVNKAINGPFKDITNIYRSNTCASTSVDKVAPQTPSLDPKTISEHSYSREVKEKHEKPRSAKKRCTDSFKVPNTLVTNKLNAVSEHSYYKEVKQKQETPRPPKRTCNDTPKIPSTASTDESDATPNDQISSLVENDDLISLSKSDNNDLETILNGVFKDCPPKIMEFLVSQQKALSNHPNGRRWSKNIIRLCLTLWCRSPRSYTELKNSGFLVLPSQKILQIYKNKFHQKAGINKELLHWMKNEALHRNLPTEGYEGGLILDEMSIQSDLQFYCKNGQTYLTGFTEISNESLFMDSILTGKKEVTLATHVLQFVFLGFTGFRFPLFHFPTKQATASELNLLFWKIVNFLQIFGFTVKYISLDGAQTNRDLVKILLGDFKSISVKTMKVQNIFSLTEQSIYVIMDYSHIMKKIRNNVSKSGKKETYKRHLLYKGHYIYWEHFISAYMWDISTNPFPIHRKLSHEHFHLTNESKMRNKLAEDVLDKEMLYLMKTYADTQGDNAENLKGTIEFLENTSILVENFRDHRAIRDIGDERLLQNQKVLEWFQDWENSVQSNSEIKDKEKHLISHQTRADICSLLIGFHEMCSDKLKKDSSSIVPNRINSDVIENVFCQQRGLYNGNNTNPTYLNYCRTMNAVILGQATISKKSNASEGTSAAEPFSKYFSSTSTKASK